MEYLVTMTTHVPSGTSDEAVTDVRAREAAHSKDLAQHGVLLRLWRPPLAPGEWRTFGLFAADSDEELEKELAGMPLRIWRTDEITPLTTHPNDPAPERRGAGGSLPEFFTIFTIQIPQGRRLRRSTTSPATRLPARRNLPVPAPSRGSGCYRRSPHTPARWGCGAHPTSSSFIRSSIRCRCRGG